MTSWTLLTITLVLFCSSTLCSLGCDLTQGLQEDFSLLNQMSTFSLVPCWKDRTNFNFPKKVMEGSQLQRENVTVIVHEMLQQIFTIFSLNATPAAWNQTQLIQLLSGLDQQLEQLESCLGQGIEWEEPSWESENPRLALKSYFQGIRQYLQSKEYSHCAWEIMSVEISRAFLFMSKITRKLRH
ncbi:interferon tau-2-like [Vombatus ursinus]|uniref:interferon tau-2-like n=1 Tax=Vombatus ursinus TaxID=29139 RepID=UPI000FFD2559|nr:interferon tau-2-like [Vombatus ursinus]